MKHLSKFKHLSFRKWIETTVIGPYMSVFLCSWVLIFNMGVVSVISSLLFNWKKVAGSWKNSWGRAWSLKYFSSIERVLRTVAYVFSCWNAWVLPWHQEAVQSTDLSRLWCLHWVCPRSCQLWSRHLSIRNYTETTNAFHTDHWKDIRWQ